MFRRSGMGLSTFHVTPASALAFSWLSALSWNRTSHLPIKGRPLYQLSYLRKTYNDEAGRCLRSFWIRNSTHRMRFGRYPYNTAGRMLSHP